MDTQLKKGMFIFIHITNIRILDNWEIFIDCWAKSYPQNGLFGGLNEIGIFGPITGYSQRLFSRLDRGTDKSLN